LRGFRLASGFHADFGTKKSKTWRFGNFGSGSLISDLELLAQIKPVWAERGKIVPCQFGIAISQWQFYQEAQKKHELKNCRVD
jgi:hypothetical protein